MKSRRGLEFSVDDLASLRKFVDDPPGGVVVREQHVTLSESVVRLPFECSAADACLVGCDLTCFLLDFTFKTNREGLLIGSIGPCGVHMTPSGPHVRFIPSLFMVAEAEDEEAHALLVNLFLEKAQ